MIGHEIMSLPFKLYRLQQIDTQHDRVCSRIQEIQTLRQKNENLEAAIENHTKINNDLQGLIKDLIRAEDNVREQRIKIETNEAALYGGKIRNPKELQDLQLEIASLKRHFSVLEERQLELMLKLEDMEKQNAEASAILSQETGKHEQILLVLRNEETNLNNELTHINDERQAAQVGFEPNEIQLYESLRKQRRGVAVAKVVNKACSACGSTLSAALFQAAFSPGQISRCETCGRILYGG
jgi:uncharacterized protein